MYFRSVGFMNSYLKTKIKHYLSNYYFGIYCVNFLPSKDNNVSLRITKFISNGLLGTTLLGDYEPVGGINIEINAQDNISVINYHMINDKQFAKSHNNLYGDPLSDHESQMINECMFEYAEHISEQHGVSKIQFDVHENLKNYNNGIRQHGYNLSGDVPTFLYKTI